MLGTVIAIAARWEFVSPPGLAAGVLLGVLVNVVLVWRTRSAGIGPSELRVHATADQLLLAWLLAFAGGLRNPFTVFFSFHLVLGALLGGRSGALYAAAMSVLCLSGLYLLEHLEWLPSVPLDRSIEGLWLVSIASLLVGLTYFALVVAQRLREERHRAIEEHEEADRNLALFLEALDRLKVGLELIGADGGSRLTNQHADRLRKMPQREQEREPAAEGWVRFAVEEPSGDRRIVDRVTVAPDRDEGAQLGAVLWVDRTEELLVEQRHVMLERLATLGRALQGIAHELNTPLMTMQTLAKDLEAALRELPLDDAVRSDLGESVELIIEESRRCKGLTQSLLMTANPQQPRTVGAGSTALQIARRAVQLVGLKPDEGVVALDEHALDVPLQWDPDRLLQVLMNLTQNALLATEDIEGEAPRVVITARPRDDDLIIIVRDRGPGLPPEVRARLFEPFVTTRPTGQGTGLGLYVSQRIMRELGGTLEIDDSHDDGTEARLYLPGRGLSTAPARLGIDVAS